MKIKSSSQLKKNQVFKLSNFKTPFCFKEKKKIYKLYEMPNFRSAFFKKSKKDAIKNKTLFISGPARSGNHLLISMLDNHFQIANEIGEDDFLRSIFSYVNINENDVIKKFNEANVDFILNSSGQPKYGIGKGINKWKKLYLAYKNKKKITVWSGNQPEGKAHISDFQGLIPRIDYLNFEKFFRINKKKIKRSKSFIEIFNLYLEAKKKLIPGYKKKEKNFVYKNRYSGSGLRRELFYLLERTKKIICITPIRNFENFYYSYSKTRHNTSKIRQSALDDLWEHWRHKVIDYLLLKKKYPKNIIIVKFEDLINDPEKTARVLLKTLKLKYDKEVMQASLLGVKSLGNSSYKKNKSIEGKYYKSSINRKLNNVTMPPEYKKIYEIINKFCLKI
jgi:hypothetical protein